MKTIRSIILSDLPWIHRLVDAGVYLDNVSRLTGSSTHEAFLASLPLGDLGMPTYVLREGRRYEAIGQLRHKLGARLAHIALISPGTASEADPEAVNLHLLEGLAIPAAQRGAHMLRAEVEETSPLFEIMRHAGFSIYTRQQIWLRKSGTRRATSDLYVERVSRATQSDTFGIHALYANVVPPLLQQTDSAPDWHADTLVYKAKDGQIKGVIYGHEGRGNVYVQALLHDDAAQHAGAILNAALKLLRCGDKAVYFCVRNYQEWMHQALIDNGFDPVRQQAVMAKHTAARVRHLKFEPHAHLDRAVPVILDPVVGEVFNIEEYGKN